MSESTREHRERRPFDYDWRSVALAGVIAGLVFLIVEMALVPLLGASIWGPPRMMAAIVMGPQVLPPPATFDLAVFAVAMIIHFSLSIIYTALLGLFLRRQNAGVATLIGAGFGLLLYLVNFFVFTGIFPWFAEARNWVSVLAHIVFGGVAGLSYVWLSSRLGERRRARVQA